MVDDACYNTLPNREDYAEYADGVYTLRTQITDIPMAVNCTGSPKLISDKTGNARVEENNGPVANCDSRGINVKRPETLYS